MKKTTKIINIILFITYISLLLYLTLFKNYLGRTTGVFDINLIPFKNIIKITNDYIINEVSLSFFIVIFKTKNIKKFFIIMFFIILFIETMQLVFKIGFFDIDDIILNLIGSIVAFLILQKTLKTKEN